MQRYSALHGIASCLLLSLLRSRRYSKLGFSEEEAIRVRGATNDTREETSVRMKKSLALFVGAASLVAGVPAVDQYGSIGMQPMDRWSVLAQSPSLNGINEEVLGKPQKLMITSTGFTAEDGSENIVARTAFEALLPKGVPKSDLTALVITAPTSLRPGYFGNLDAPVDSESFGPQLAKSGVGNIISLDVLSKSHLNLESAEASDWSDFMDKAYNVSTGAPTACKMLQNMSVDSCDGLDMSLGDKMIKAGAALDAKYSERIRELVSKADIIAVNGGDPAAALLAMRTSPEFTKAVMERIRSGDAVFIGRSAGAMLAGADAGLTHEIPQHVRMSLLGGNTTGLQLIPGSGGGKGAIRPHYGSHWNEAMIDYESALVNQGKNVTFYGIPNGEALTCLGDDCREIGDHGLSETQFVNFLKLFEDVVTTRRLKAEVTIEELS